jgi:effector-binding domain-containing protein
VTIPTNDQVPAYLSQAYGEVYKHIGEQGTESKGPGFAIWHQPAAVLAGEIAEVAVPVARAVASSATVKVYELPEALVAFAVRQGEAGNFAQLHAALLDWIEANNYLVIGPYREIYKKPTDESDCSTEIQYPVAKAN